jgi:hypothetical protein
MVSDAPLSASSPDHLGATQGSAFNAVVATFTDPGAAGSYTATITWGDGLTSTGTIIANGGGSFTVSGSHSYAAEGRYTVSVSIADPGGSTVNVTTISHVARTGPPPTRLGEMANSLTHSAEYYARFIRGIYEKYLQREPDADGLAYWVSQMQNGLSDEHLEAGFIGSAEYIQNHGGTGEAWIIGMYEDLLGRAPDPNGLAYWLAQLQKGTSPVAIAYGFAASAEREAIRVTRDYQIYLGRNPSPAEVNYWVDQFVNHGASNEDVIAGFVGSAEYFVKNYNNVQDYLDTVYQDVLGRAPDPAGYNSWINILA